MTNPIRGVTGAGEPTGINPSASAKSGPANQGASATGGTAPGADSADVTQTQTLLETINATVAGVPTVNQNHVAVLRAAIANGTYQVNPQQVAKQILSSEQALTGPATGE